jgi:uncharacterized protein YndB with AHSA1/START domain
VLRTAGLVDVRKDAQRRIYALRLAPIAEIDAWLAARTDGCGTTASTRWASYLDNEQPRDRTMIDHGTYVEHDGRPAVRFTRRYPHSAERVWAAVSEPAGLRHWFPSRVELEPARGRSHRLPRRPQLPEETSGTILAYDPPRQLAFTWGGDELHLTVEPDGEGGRAHPAQRAGGARHRRPQRRGWTVCLAELEKHLRGDRPTARTAPPPSRGRSSTRLRAAGMPSGAPIPG